MFLFSISFNLICVFAGSKIHGALHCWLTVCDWYCPVVGAPQVARTLSTYWAAGRVPAEHRLNYLTQAHQSRPRVERKWQRLCWLSECAWKFHCWTAVCFTFSLSKSSDTIKYVYLYSWAGGSKRSHDPGEQLGRYHNLCFGSNLCWIDRNKTNVMNSLSRC